LGWFVQQRGFEDLAGDFTAGDYFRGGFSQYLIAVGDKSLVFVLVAAVEHDCDQALRFNFSGSGKRKVRFHRLIFQYPLQGGESATWEIYAGVTRLTNSSLPGTPQH